ncbi:hypothetical protein [Shouchella lehensis]|uniref:Uncharacterized protein n=2 Tax=Bacillaceae TaxID=186817 RepID=A0A9D5DVY0_9BACI|nr:hypothetical protein [Shouchella lehensis]KQL59086.1 hypothetical protein AN965_00135 [Alkalicoccobacillus plakortidis]MBG9782533.1 hypothetical protein [Shouchella lehensis]RQW22016.1 hypothetical protein EH196_05745 [Bacillus sp. C1-1]TES47858.1 hypothetical protein E2L03_11890 [Shouchella lehensis]
MYRFNKWIDSFLLALVCGSVYLTLSIIHDDQVKWLNALIIATSLFLTWALVFPRLRETRSKTNTKK